METNANYAAVGAFVFASILALVVVLLWLTGAQYSEEYAYYQTYFYGSVSGLGKGTSTRFNGIEVGRVTQLKFDPNNPKRVIVIMQIDPTLKIKEDSVASIASEGITGGSYVEIEGGSKNSPVVERQPGERYPTIKSEQSTLQQLAQSAPQVIAKLNKVGDELSDLLNDKNRKAVSDTLANLQMTTGVIAKRSGDLDAAIDNLSRASGELNTDLTQLNTVLVHTDQAAVNANRILSGDTMGQVTQLVTETRSLVNSLKRVSNQLDREPTKLIFGDRRQGYQPK
ncbi:MAG: MCE family protein [Proteobacteria bacterium]|nr:MCE family protein [Pseudomonadota bacterium]